MTKGSAESVIRRAFSLFFLFRPQCVSGFGLRADLLSSRAKRWGFRRLRAAGRSAPGASQVSPGRATYFLHAQRCHASPVRDARLSSDSGWSAGRPAALRSPSLRSIRAAHDGSDASAQSRQKPASFAGGFRQALWVAGSRTGGRGTFSCTRESTQRACPGGGPPGYPPLSWGAFLSFRRP